MLAADRYSEAFALIADLGIATGAAPLTKHAGCWEHDLGDGWHLAVNGHRETMKTAAGGEVPFGHALVTRNGWPLAILHPRGGEVVSGQDAEDALIGKLRAALELSGG